MSHLLTVQEAWLLCPWWQNTMTTVLLYFHCKELLRLHHPWNWPQMHCSCNKIANMIQLRQQYISDETALLDFKTSKFWNNFALFLKIFCTLPKEGCLLNTPTLLEILVKLHTFPHKNIGIDPLHIWFLNTLLHGVGKYVFWNNKFLIKANTNIT